LFTCGDNCADVGFKKFDLFPVYSGSELATIGALSIYWSFRRQGTPLFFVFFLISLELSSEGLQKTKEDPTYQQVPSDDENNLFASDSDETGTSNSDFESEKREKKRSRSKGKGKERPQSKGIHRKMEFKELTLTVVPLDDVLSLGKEDYASGESSESDSGRRFSLPEFQHR
jgi:hypothetical protein